MRPTSLILTAGCTEIGGMSCREIEVGKQVFQRAARQHAPQPAPSCRQAPGRRRLRLPQPQQDLHSTGLNAVVLGTVARLSVFPRMSARTAMIITRNVYRYRDVSSHGTQIKP